MPRQVITRDHITYLVGISIIESCKDLPLPFRTYDTTYGNDEEYELPLGRSMILFLFTMADLENRACLWSTIRRWTPEKEDYYKKLIGKEIGVEIR